FLVDTIGRDNFVDLFAHTYSYSRTRLVAPGDTQLFRPALFALLSAEKAFFGTNFVLWQATGLLMHFLACCLMLKVMLRLQSLAAPATQPSAPFDWHRFSPLTCLPYVFTVFFALNYAVVEQVIWHHLNGYILFVICLLGSLLLLLRA